MKEEENCFEMKAGHSLGSCGEREREREVGLVLFAVRLREGKKRKEGGKS